MIPAETPSYSPEAWLLAFSFGSWLEGHPNPRCSAEAKSACGAGQPDVQPLISDAIRNERSQPSRRWHASSLTEPMAISTKHASSPLIAGRGLLPNWLRSTRTSGVSGRSVQFLSWKSPCQRYASKLRTGATCQTGRSMKVLIFKTPSIWWPKAKGQEPPSPTSPPTLTNWWSGSQTAGFELGERSAEDVLCRAEVLGQLASTCRSQARGERQRQPAQRRSIGFGRRVRCHRMIATVHREVFLSMRR
jgi:hypothetical protein